MSDQGQSTNTGLSEDKSAVTETAPVAAEEAQTGLAAAGLHEAKGLGLEIANIASLPDAEDYALHDFYRTNFTPSEIAYCIKQPGVKAAFQGLLAAKRAIIKSGAANRPPEGLSQIEIGFDGDERPIYPGCLLSISDNGTIAVAVCFWLGGLGLQVAQLASGEKTARAQPLKFTWRARFLAFVVLLSLLILFGLGIWKVLELGRH
jgi:phosphopantetheinyl transferase (holo-ACP synthase)